MTDSLMIVALAVQIASIVIGLLAIPWGGKRLGRAALSLRLVREHLEQLAVRMSGRPGDPPDLDGEFDQEDSAPSLPPPSLPPFRTRTVYAR